MAAAPPPTEQVAVILEKSAKEQELGILGPWQPRAYFDAKYGCQGWRALKRFAVWQAGAGSWRVIDNGRSASTNEATASVGGSTPPPMSLALPLSSA